MLDSTHFADYRCVFVKLWIFSIISIGHLRRITYNLRRTDFGKLIQIIYVLMRLIDFICHCMVLMALVISALGSTIWGIIIIALGSAASLWSKDTVVGRSSERIVSSTHVFMVFLWVINTRKKWLISLCFKMKVWLYYKKNIKIKTSCFWILENQSQNFWKKLKWLIWLIFAP